MNTAKIGRDFEKKAYKFLKLHFDEVNWLSREKWTSHIDFECWKDGKRYLIECKKSINNCFIRGKNWKKIKFFITLKKGKITLIKPRFIEGIDWSKIDIRKCFVPIEKYRMLNLKKAK